MGGHDFLGASCFISTLYLVEINQIQGRFQPDMRLCAGGYLIMHCYFRDNLFGTDYALLRIQ